jgi:catechol 2,3-dioxygenase-like lactoylglutathione lyase family enzyme
MIIRIDHIQLAAPKGCEGKAREFYGTLLGLREIEKPASLLARGGCWFQCGDQQLHIGVESDFRPAKKAHPAFLVAELDKLRENLIAHGAKITDDASTPTIRGATGSNSSKRAPQSKSDSGNAGEQGAEARFHLAKSDIGLVHRVQGKEQTLAKNCPLLPLVRGNTSEQQAKAHVGVCGTNWG